MASADVLRVTITGKGGHASEPYRAIDPVPVACEIVTALNTMITRSIDVFDPAVLTVGKISAGTTNNVIPETAEIIGTIRAVSEHTRAKVHDGLKRVAAGIAEAHGCGSDVEITYGYPVTSNHDAFADFSLELAADLTSPDEVVRQPNPVMGAEDFSYVLQGRPGLMAFLGVCPDDIENSLEAAPNHSNRMRVNESAMPTGAALHVAMALTP